MISKRHRSAPLRNQLVATLKGYLSGGECMGGQLPCEVELAERFHVSRKTLRSALEVLEGENLIRRIHGKGTFRADNNLNPLSKIIYYIVPCADYTIASGSSRNGIDLLLAGLLRACAGTDWRVVTLPFSRTNILTDIDYETLNIIEPGAKVFLSGMWYRYGFRFFQERNCDVIFLFTQNFSIHFPDDDNYTPYIRNWHQMRQDAASLTRIGTEELFRRGCRRPLLCAPYLMDVTNMKLSGFQEAGGTLYWDIPKNFSDFEMFKKELWKKYRETDFDSLFLDCAYDFEPDYRYSLARNLGLPEDVEIIVQGELDCCRRMYPRISYVTYDYGQICRDALEIWKRNPSKKEKHVYQAFLHNYE